MSLARFLTPSTTSAEATPGACGADKNTIVRNLLVQISGCRVTWEHLGTHGAVWRVNPEHADAF